MEKEKVSYKEIIDRVKPELEKVAGFLNREFQKIRTERVSPALVEDVQVEYFGKIYPLKQLAAISVPHPKEIVIQPWDESYIENITKALERSGGVGASPVVDKKLIRINLPPLSEEYRKDLIRMVGEKNEQARKTIRKWRDDAWREIQDSFQGSKMSEDDKYKGKDKLEEMIDEYKKKIDEMVEKKKKEIEN